VQFDRPEAILSHPADAFVEAFVGSDRALKRLALLPVAKHVLPGVATPAGTRVPLGDDLREALSALLAADAESAPVVDGSGAVCGVITLAAIRKALGDAPAPGIQ
jgi:osmoprotectant transport system ATP-binding protein